MPSSVAFVGSQKFVPASSTWRKGITWHGFPRFCDSRFSSPFSPYIPSWSWPSVDIFQGPIMPRTIEIGARWHGGEEGDRWKGEAVWRNEERKGKGKERKEKKTSRASCIYYGALTATKVRVADTRGTRDREPAFHVLLAREKENGARVGPPRETSRYGICIERMKFRCVHPYPCEEPLTVSLAGSWEVTGILWESFTLLCLPARTDYTPAPLGFIVLHHLCFWL